MIYRWDREPNDFHYFICIVICALILWATYEITH